MNASLQMLVEPMMFVITPLDRTGVNVQMDLLLIPVHRTHWIQFVSVRRWIIKKWQKERTVRKFTSGFLPTFQKSHKVESVDRAIFVWPWKMVSVSVRYLFLSKHGLFVFPPKKILIWRRHCSIGQSCYSMTSKRSICWFLESSRGWRFFTSAFV